MKTIIISAIFFGSILSSVNAFSATEVQKKGGVSVTGHISFEGATNLDDLVSALSKKADKSGAQYFLITSAGGKNKLHGSAILLK